MKPPKAIALAKSYVADLFADENPANIGLEEIKFKRHRRRWAVTIGFFRSWEEQSALGLAAGLRRPRTYKIVVISDKDGTVLSVKHRQVGYP